jgi:hypothetical protein
MALAWPATFVELHRSEFSPALNTPAIVFARITLFLYDQENTLFWEAFNVFERVRGRWAISQNHPHKAIVARRKASRHRVFRL